MPKVKGRTIPPEEEKQSQDVEESESGKEMESGKEIEPGKLSVRAYFRKELDIDVVKVFKGLKQIAELPADEFKDRMALTRAINSAAGNAWRANLVFLKARTEREMFRVEKDALLRDLTFRATSDLETHAKEMGIKKQITVDQVRQQLSTMDEYVDLIRREQEIREMRDACQSLAVQWSDRKGLLQTQARLVTAELEVKLKGLDRKVG